MTIEPKTAFRRYYQKAPFDRLLESKALDLPLRPTYGWLPFAPMIYTPKGFSSKMTLEVAPRGFDIATVKV